MSSGPFWDGQPRRDYGDAGPLISPYDRPPVPQSLAASAVPADSPDVRKRVTFAPWCGWVYVQDDGGGTLVIYPSLGGGLAQAARSGDVVWIGNGSCEIAYAVAPATPVRLMGCTNVDAMLFAAQGRPAADVAAPVVRFVANDPIAASSDGELITGSADGVTSRIIYDPTDDSGIVVWVGSEAQVIAGKGLPLVEGGLYDLPGEQWVATASGAVNIYSGQFQT